MYIVLFLLSSMTLCIYVSVCESMCVCVCVCYADCSMWLRDDSVYEGVERLYLELDYSPQDPQVQIIPSRKRATIYIHDTQDGMLHTANPKHLHTEKLFHS